MIPMPLQSLSLRHLAYLTASFSTLLFAATSLAAERVVLKYGPLRETVLVKDLETLAKTGQAPPSLALYLRAANQKPEDVQKTLNKQVKMDAVVLDRVLNSSLANGALDELGKTIHPPAKGADRQALRAALVLSASDDGKVSLLETIQKYPTAEVQVEGDRLVNAALQLGKVAEQIEKIRGLIKLF
jgi:hypothetical protein